MLGALRREKIRGNMPAQIKRLLLIFAALIGSFVIARHFLVPSSFGKYGHYRADAIGDIEALPLQYAGAGACADCHGDLVKRKLGSKHRTVACESCHGPALSHAGDPMNTKPSKPVGREFCLLCHSANAARPASIKQINSETHNPETPCTVCHNPHNPKL